MENAITSSFALAGEGIVECWRGEFLISTSRERLSLDVVHGFLTNCYWAHGIPREVVERSIKHSLCFGVYEGSGAQVGLRVWSAILPRWLIWAAMYSWWSRIAGTD